MLSENIHAVTDHYQKTFELTYETWKERNKLFIYLIFTTSAGLLFLLRVPEFDKLLVESIASILEIDDPNRITQLYTNFPFDVLLSAILVIFFYLMQKLYSTNLSVFRHYLYLGAVEDEIRIALNLPDNSVLFTREGKFYWDRRSIVQNVSKWSYVFVILVTLLPYVSIKIGNDISLKNPIITGVDIIVSLLAFLYLWEYARSAQQFDIRKLPSSISKESNLSKSVK